MSTSRNRNLWTPGEDAKLKALVGRYGDARGSQSKWKNVADLMPGRTAKDCRKRWFHSLDPSLRKGRWTAEEDQTLLQAYARLGPAWYVIANMIPGRKDDQCAKRYNEILDPSAKNRLCQWSAEEDDILREGVRTLGNQWSAISQRLPGRPPLTCRNRWRALSRNSSSPTTRDTPQASADESTTNTPTVVEEDASKSSSSRATESTQFSFQSPGPLDPALFADPGDLGSLSEWWNDPSFFHGTPMQAMGNLLASPRGPAAVALGEASVIASAGTPPLNNTQGQKIVVAGGQPPIDDMQYITSSELTDSTTSPAVIAFPEHNSQPQYLSYETGVQDVQFTSRRTPDSFTTTTNTSNDSSTDEVTTSNPTQTSRQQRPHRVAPSILQQLSTDLDLGLGPAAKASQNMFRNPPANSQAMQTHSGEQTTADYTEPEQNPEQSSSVVVTSNGSQHIYHHYHYHYHHHHHHYHHNDKT